MSTRTTLLLAPLVLTLPATAQSADPAAGSSLPRTVVGPPQTHGSAGHALDFVVGSGLCGGNSAQTIGWAFNVQQEVTVTSMSWFDDGLDGLDLSHEVGIFDPQGVLIASTYTIIPAGTAATLDGIWRTVSIPPTVLPVGAGYIVAGYNGGQTECLSFNVTQTPHPSLQYVDATYSLINGIFEIPTNFSAADNGFYGVSFKVNESSATPYCNPGGANSVSAGGAVLTSTGDYGLPTATFRVTDVPNQPGILYAGTGQGNLAFGCGQRCVVGTVVRGPVVVPSGNVLDTSFSMIPTAPYIQYWYRDPANFSSCGSAFNLSNALMP